MSIEEGEERFSAALPRDRWVVLFDEGCGMTDGSNPVQLGGPIATDKAIPLWEFGVERQRMVASKRERRETVS